MINRRNGVIGTVIAAVAVAGLAVGCGAKATEPFHDSPRSQHVNTAPADLIEMPDGFNNLATKCDHHNRIYVTFHGDGSYGAVTVVKDDPSCP
jgi:hypothetical protein